jgi:hypothetical protein
VPRPRELEPRLSELLRVTPGSAGFGYEGVLMRRYLALAQEGVGLAGRPCAGRRAGRDGCGGREALRREDAVRYHTLANEDLV